MVTGDLGEVCRGAECVNFGGTAGNFRSLPLSGFSNILPTGTGTCKEFPGLGIDRAHLAVYTLKNLSAHPLAVRLSSFVR